MCSLPWPGREKSTLFTRADSSLRSTPCRPPPEAQLPGLKDKRLESKAQYPLLVILGPLGLAGVCSFVWTPPQCRTDLFLVMCM